jgi:hypothetical protein
MRSSVVFRSSPDERAVHAEELARDAFGGGRQHRREVDRQRAEAAHHVAAHRVQQPAACGILGQLPRLVAVEVLVRVVGDAHHLTQCLAVLALVEELPDLLARGECHRMRARRRAGRILRRGEPTVELPHEEARRAAGDVDVLADEVAVDPLLEVVRIEVDVLDVGVELRSDVVAEPLRVHADFEVAQRTRCRCRGFCSSSRR